MAGSYIYAWDSTLKKWVKVKVTATGKIKVATSYE